jgi:hypothetical protein
MGIGLAAQAIADRLPAFGEWLADVLHDTRLHPAGRFQELIYQHVRAMLGGEPVQVECLGAVLRRFEAAMRRWRWDDDSLASPVR